jgi:two-component system CheB/CheR fusion protein
VIDTGRGINPELLPRVFEPFVQGKQGAPNPHGGLGLGLSIARNLVEEHGGQISAESEGEGKGACFAVVLTTTAARPSRVSREVTAGARRAGGRPISVLVVEDDDDTREVMRQLLGEVGFDVRVAMSIESAVTAFEEHPVEVLVSDIGLPDGSGHDLLGRLKTLEPGLRAIVLSGYGMEQDFEKSRAAGFTEHFVKPVNFERLIATIQRLASGSLRPA